MLIVLSHCLSPTKHDNTISISTRPPQMPTEKRRRMHAWKDQQNLHDLNRIQITKGSTLNEGDLVAAQVSAKYVILLSHAPSQPKLKDRMSSYAASKHMHSIAVPRKRRQRDELNGENYARKTHIFRRVLNPANELLSMRVRSLRVMSLPHAHGLN